MATLPPFAVFGLLYGARANDTCNVAHPEQSYAEQHDEAAVNYFGMQMSQETGIPLQECIDRIEEDLRVGRVTIDFDEKRDRFRLVPVPTASDPLSRSLS